MEHIELITVVHAQDPAEIARLPARDVLVKQIANAGDPAHMFSIGTRAAWDATVRAIFSALLLASPLQRQLD
jgi:hypothetical protein